MSKVITFEFEKETKNTVRYKEECKDGETPVIGTLYIQKTFAGTSKNIQITIEKLD